MNQGVKVIAVAANNAPKPEGRRRFNSQFAERFTKAAKASPVTQLWQRLLLRGSD
jgi:hypothetical protein